MAGNQEEARDLMSETVLVAYENLNRLKKKEAFAYFLLGIAKRIFLNGQRRRKFQGDYNPLHAANQEDESNHPERQENADLLYHLLAALPLEQKEAIVLFEINGFNLQEVAELQKCSLSAVKSRLARGREKLTRLLQNEEIVNQAKNQ